jgi:diacylglycerol kinase family enzyme
MLRGHSIDVGLEVAGAAVTRRTPLLWLGMGWGSFPRVHEAVERRAEPDLELAVLRADSFVPATALLVRLSGKLMRRQLPIDDPAVEILHTRTLTLHARHRIDATADGEILRVHPPVEIAVRDAALRVLVPPPAEPEE